MNVRLLKRLVQTFSEQDYIVTRPGNLPIDPFLGLEISMSEGDVIAVYMVTKVIVALAEEIPPKNQTKSQERPGEASTGYPVAVDPITVYVEPEQSGTEDFNSETGLQ
ncbi:MAG: hypothetical protein JOZ57_05385 [Abitibacteriaceae bacterium]|nr:hypothetical protein [Abditibacteriaceae bacterium]